MPIIYDKHFYNYYKKGLLNMYNTYLEFKSVIDRFQNFCHSQLATLLTVNCLLTPLRKWDASSQSSSHTDSVSVRVGNESVSLLPLEF